MVDEKLSPALRLMIGAVAVMMGAVGFVSGRFLLRPAQGIVQPIEFNHRLHVEDVGADCLTCHFYYETSQHSGLPTLETCMDCHEGGITESEEEQRLLTLASADPLATFRKLFRMPDHVNYSHREHTVAAGLECEVCHGSIAETTAPPSRPLVRITMDTCVDCHAAQGVRTDCTPCHR